MVKHPAYIRHSLQIRERCGFESRQDYQTWKKFYYGNLDKNVSSIYVLTIIQYDMLGIYCLINTSTTLRGKMFTVETEWDHTKVVIMDDAGKHNDMTVRFSEDGVYMSQWYEDENRYHTVWVSNKMVAELILSLKSNDGTFTVDR